MLFFFITSCIVMSAPTSNPSADLKSNFEPYLVTNFKCQGIVLVFFITYKPLNPSADLKPNFEPYLVTNFKRQDVSFGFLV